MEIKTVLIIHTLMLIVGGIRKCLATQYLPVAEGETLVLRCSRKNLSDNGHIEWRNPQGHLLFFNNVKGLRDSRSSIFSISSSEYTLHIANVTLKDEGIYKCLLYENKVVPTTFKVKVLGIPKIEMAEYKDKTTIKCSAAANGPPPELSWKISGVEIEALPNTLREERSNRSLAVSLLTVKTHIRKATVMCLAKHTALPRQLISVIIIENHSVTTSTTSYSSTRDELKTDLMITATSAPVFSSTAHVELPSISESTEVFPTRDSTTSNTIQEEYSTATNISSTTHNINSSSSPVESMTTNDTSLPVFYEPQSLTEGSPLLILLVTSLVICLLTVVTFLLFRMRKAHLAWKKENEESNQSVESSKSKYSHEEKQSQEGSKPGFWNPNFTEYKLEEPPQNTATSVATVDVITETQDSSTAAFNKLDQACMKETEL
ncbi:cytotoxic and regulatory T-cell molecule-like isoform X2 [Carassius carassius]|uniref:cytotoxic and regulatory T-cell molecule-like isoform X2 n=1 Tax=Carassius carassius TaxID=217509 RepID=UPI0028687FE5|nr:cytotoxic and regulatory T-cell molecule-like isoform X2 [Carassius carassius]